MGAFQFRMKVAVLFLFALVCVASANHIGYIAYFPTADCSGDAYAISPLFPGDSSFCSSGANTCLRSLGGLTQPGLTNCPVRNYQAVTNNGVEGVGILQNAAQVFVPYGQCQNTTQSDFVGFLSYTDQGCGTYVVDMRVPIFEGVSEICEAVSTSCTGSLRGFSLPRDSNSRICTSATRSLVNDDCTVIIDEGLAT